MCIACGRKQAKSALFRFVCDNAGHIRPDVQQRLGGRGGYLCFNEKCLEDAIRCDKFSKAFRRKGNDSENVLGGIRWLKPEFMKLPKNLV
jgi:predicted RNA-binding protein YlxR (DUF448 family)